MFKFQTACGGGILERKICLHHLGLVKLREELRSIDAVRFLLTSVACEFCCARCSCHAKFVYIFHDLKLFFGYNWCWVLIHVSKSHRIFRVIHDSRKQVVGLIYTKQIVSKTLSHATKLYQVNRPLDSLFVRCAPISLPVSLIQDGSDKA